MTRDIIRQLPNLRAIASRDHPQTPLKDLGIHISYESIPPVVKILSMGELRRIIIDNGSRHVNQKEVLTDEQIKNLRDQGISLVLMTLHRALQNRENILRNMMASIWDNPDAWTSEMVNRSADIVPSHDDLQAQMIAQIPAPMRTEKNNPKLRRLMDEMIEEERRRRNDIQGTWLTAPNGEAIS